ncbi:hypothetical protein EZ449_12265 [Pedobacter frigidisoli]|uniref:Immunity protein 26 n=1 Tax=Pedobacter frigidisoli TaxID=2530455 RepID=A0A4R0P3B1_9SPHI|nr:Imm26 family immunity protein [Pedobacter frigidisoli]TCD08607.1 hypothetical protein EZ449_12265 [Pedobacter frigidisoli]
MEKSIFITGDVFQIPLPSNLGFAYATGIDLISVNESSNYPTLLRVFNFRSLEKMKTFSTDFDLVLCPLLIAGIHQVLKKKKWDIVGKIELKQEDLRIPDYKKNDLGIWYYVSDSDISTKKATNFNNVKHLETLGAIGAEIVNTKIAMALLKDEEKKISDYFKLDSYFERHFYEDIIEIPTYYKQSDEIKGKALR